MGQVSFAIRAPLGRSGVFGIATIGNDQSIDRSVVAAHISGVEAALAGPIVANLGLAVWLSCDCRSFGSANALHESLHACHGISSCGRRKDDDVLCVNLHGVLLLTKKSPRSGGQTIH